MARIELAPEVLDDFDRFFDHLSRFDVGSATGRVADIGDALQLLRNSPLIGRPVSNGKRELVIGKDARGYVVLYRYVETIDVVFVLAVRSQRESGYKHET